MNELDFLIGYVRALSFLASLIMIGAWMFEAKKLYRVSSAFFVIFLATFSVFITNGFLYALGSFLLLLSMPFIAALLVHGISFVLLKQVESKHGNSGLKLKLKPFDIYRLT